MLDMKFVRENPELVKENIKKKFQDEKLPLVDQVIELDERRRAAMTKADELRANRNKLSKEIGALMAQGKKEEGMALRQKVADQAKELEELTKEANELNEQVTKIMMTIPNIIDPSVPIGKDDSENVEVERFGEPVVPDFEVPYHTDIMERFDGIDLDAARKVAGNGFYYLMGDIARLHSAVISYARDFMIDRGFLKLSSGEQRLVLLARAFVKDPELLILDEPLHGLDNRNRRAVCFQTDCVRPFGADCRSIRPFGSIRLTVVVAIRS